MNKTVSAIYAAGSLQLLEAVELPDATRVQPRFTLGQRTVQRYVDKR